MIAHGLAVPYPDELAYSVIARSLKRWHYAHNHRLLCTLFQSEPPIIDLTAPSHLSRVAKAYGFASARTFAARHTLLPYYLAFVPERQRASTLKALFAEEHKATSHLLLIRSPAGLEPPFLRCCNDCVRFDLLRYGETYWHRSHQLPAVSKCLRHLCGLRWSSIPYRPKSPTDYWAATESGLLRSQTSRYFCPIRGALADDVNRQSLELLSAGFGHRNVHMSCDGYREALNQTGYVAVTGRIDARLLGERIAEFVGPKAATARSLGIERWWLQAARRSSRHRLTPVQHLLMQAFIRSCRASRPSQAELLL